jgi:ankyrin repeat protein
MLLEAGGDVNAVNRQGETVRRVLSQLTATSGRNADHGAAPSPRAVFLASAFVVLALVSGCSGTTPLPTAATQEETSVQNEKTRLLELTPAEQQAADRDAALLDAARKMNGPNAPSVKQLFPGAIRISDLEAGASGGKMHQVKLALKKGDDVNGPCVMYGSPLHAAAARGHLDVVKLLVAYGANIQARDAEGKTAAEVACKPEIAEFLRAGK